MSLSNPRIIYGIHSISPYQRSDKMPFGILKVIGSANLALSSDSESLYAGSNKYAWATENKTVSTELTAKVKAYPGFLFQLFLGASVVDSGVDLAGTVSVLKNAKGTSVMSPTTGISGVVVKALKKENLKFGKYVVKALSANTIGLYLLSDVDLARGMLGEYVDDTLKVNATPLTVVTVAGVDVDSHGLTFTGGSAATAFVIGDTATFEVMPPSNRSSVIIVGRSTDSFPGFGALLMAQKRATGEMFEIDAHSCVGGGLPISLEENAFSQPELKMNCLYDAELDRVFTIRHILPV